MNDANEQTQNPRADNEPAQKTPVAVPQVDNTQIPPDKNACCVNHPEKQAFRTCRACSRPFCIKCLTHHMGIYYCDECRAAAISAINANDEHSEAIAAQFHRTSLSGEATDYPGRAFKWALLGLIPAAGIVISLIALIFGFSAISHPTLVPGKKTSQKAIYAVVISASSFIAQIIIGLALLIKLGG